MSMYQLGARGMAEGRMVSSTKIPSLSRTYLCALKGVGTLTTVFNTGKHFIVRLLCVGHEHVSTGLLRNFLLFPLFVL